MDEPRVPESTKVVFARLLEEMAEGFTGEIRLVCSEGGIVDVYQTDRWNAKSMRRMEGLGRVN